MKKSIFKNKKFWIISTTLISTSLIVSQSAFAGVLAPLLPPATTMYTLDDIFTKLTTNADAVEAAHNFAPAGPPAPSLHTLKEIYEAIPTINPVTVTAGTQYLGIQGSFLRNLFNGTRTSGNYPGGSQKFGGIEDWNANGASTPLGQNIPADSYQGPWTQCDNGNNYCGTGDSGAEWQDDLTGTIWSKTLNNTTFVPDGSDGDISWHIANNCEGGHGNMCVKNSAPNPNTGCEANTNWYVPHQKQLMQAYIDGSYGPMEPKGVSSGASRIYWSATTFSNPLSNAFTVRLTSGHTGGNAKTSGFKVRCVYAT